jgi:4-hydroxybenzoate polyprenyltransferase
MFVLLSILTLSSATMLWAFWHYPVGTGIATVAVLLAFGILVRLARAIDTDIVDSVPGEQSA